MKPFIQFACIIALGLGACRDESSPLVAPTDDQVPGLSNQPRPAELIPGQYVVVFRDDVPDVKPLAKALATNHRGRVRSTSTAALKGMAVELPDVAAAALRRDPAVAYVEQDQVVYAIGEPVVQPDAPVGLDRVDQRSLPLSGTYSYATDGSGVRVYILDTGINFAHASRSSEASCRAAEPRLTST